MNWSQQASSEPRLEVAGHSETYLDREGGFANTTVAKDGDLVEHAWGRLESSAARLVWWLRTIFDFYGGGRWLCGIRVGFGGKVRQIAQSSKSDGQ